MKIKRWWDRNELQVFIPSFDEYAEKYLATLVKAKPVSQVAALKAQVAALQLQLETKQPVPPVEKARDGKA